MKTLEKSIQEALSALQTEAGKAGRLKTCPSAELLGMYAENILTEPEREALSGHLAHCRDCLDAVLAYAAFVPENAGEAEGFREQEHWTRKAMDLLEGEKREALFDLAVRWVKGKLEALPSALSTLAPVHQPAFALRGPGEDQPRESLRVQKSMRGLSVEVEVSADDEGRWTIHVLVEPASGGGMPEGVRVTLKNLSVRKELHSAPVQERTALFRNLAAGPYGLEFKQMGRGLGEIALELG